MDMTSASRFSRRTAWILEESALTSALRASREGSKAILDLTCSNPTVCGFDYGDIVLSPTDKKAASAYNPRPLGLRAAREAVARYYAEHRATVAAEAICLTTSTSEAYSFIFRLLCDPGDEVLVASPSYPLFGYLAQLDDVVLREYPLHYDPNADAAHNWSIDLKALEAAITTRCKAIVLVHPNNPTGNFVSSSERLALESVCIRYGLALIVDEVFLDYAMEPGADSFAVEAHECLCFILSGVSKVCALPQMKVSWIVTCGPADSVSEAMSRLEIIADTFLSMSMPAQLALPSWLEGRRAIQAQILQRMRMNLATLDAKLAGTQAQRLQMQGGWTTVVRVPRTVGGKAFAMAALERGVLVQPGELYDLPEGRIVLSLLTPPEEWEGGVAMLPIDG